MPNYVRVITGTAKGKYLEIPKKSRPITDRAKSTLFSVIGEDIKDKRILDLYAGSGSIGIEALSRGAASCTFVDISKPACRVIEKNLENTDLFEKSEVVASKTQEYLELQVEDSFDIVFADPPYTIYEKTPDGIEKMIDEIERIIPEGGAVVLKYPTKFHFKNIPENLVEADKRSVGDNSTIIWVKVRDR